MNLPLPGGAHTIGQVPAGAGGGLCYIAYAPAASPYTLAAAGRGAGASALVHLWDERCGRAPVARLACPGGNPLVASLEWAADGQGVLGLIGNSTVSVAAVKAGWPVTAVRPQLLPQA